MTSLHAHNERKKTARILEWLSAGEELALVSDAGTPLVSDPGARIVEAVVEAGHSVVPIPGPSAVLAALVGAGFPFHRFTFLGFLPRKGRERRALMEQVASGSETTVLFESPERLQGLLAELEGACGGERRAVVAREITKLYEEFVRGTLTDLVEAFASRPTRGEITVVVSPAGEGPSGPASLGDEEVQVEATALGRSLLEEGMSASRVSKELTRRLGLTRNRAYGLVQELVGEGKGGPSEETSLDDQGSGSPA
jgi:16S rRNA (cytidine1402-2'-O)-methyltransferase